MKIYSLVIFDQDVYTAPTDYLGSYSNLENAIEAYKAYLKDFYETKEELTKAIKLISKEKQEGYGYSETLEALKIIESNVNEPVNYYKNENSDKIDYEQIYQDALKEMN